MDVAAKSLEHRSLHESILTYKQETFFPRSLQFLKFIEKPILFQAVG